MAEPAHRASRISFVVDVALDGTFSYFQFMGSNVQAALNYLVQLTAASSVIYERDLSAKFWLTFCRVWTTPEPFTRPGTFNQELNDFGDFWNQNMKDIRRNFAAKITRSDSGGIANVNRLCDIDRQFSLAYSVCGIKDGHFPQPVRSGDSWWDLLVVTHEWGHIFGARHTHCYSPPLDSCYADEDGCYSGPVRCRRGTIMSYCHYWCGGSSNLDPWFHPVQSNELYEHLRAISARSCVSRTLDPSYVDLNNRYKLEDGTINHPWKTVLKGVRWVTPGGTVLISPGNYPEALKLLSRCILQRNGTSGSVVIGQK